MEAFESGTAISHKHLSKRELEEIKKKNEDKAANDVLQTYIDSFNNSQKTKAKVFVKSLDSDQSKGSIFFSNGFCSTLN